MIRRKRLCVIELEKYTRPSFTNAHHAESQYVTPVPTKMSTHLTFCSSPTGALEVLVNAPMIVFGEKFLYLAGHSSKLLMCTPATITFRTFARVVRNVFYAACSQGPVPVRTSLSIPQRKYYHLTTSCVLLYELGLCRHSLYIEYVVSIANNVKNCISGIPGTHFLFRQLELSLLCATLDACRREKRWCLVAIKKKARTIVRRGQKTHPRSELRLIESGGRRRRKKCGDHSRMNLKKPFHFSVAFRQSKTDLFDLTFFRLDSSGPSSYRQSGGYYYSFSFLI